jgi:hypothetical protein
MRALNKGFLLAGAAFALLPCMSLAQDTQQSDRPPEAQQRQQQQRRMAMLAQRLKLTADQKQQWQQINRETNEKIWAVRRNESLNEFQMQARLRKIHKEQREQVMALLSPVQQGELKAFTEEQKQRQNKAPNNSSGDNSSAGPASSTQNNDNGTDQDDDLFAGMTSDDPAPSDPAQNKKAAPPK